MPKSNYETKLTGHEAILMAQRHADMAVCSPLTRVYLDLAEDALKQGNERRAKYNAKQSLWYSVGQYHSDYIIVKQAIEKDDDSAVDTTG
jgi:hypothetical protein